MHISLTTASQVVKLTLNFVLVLPTEEGGDISTLQPDAGARMLLEVGPEDRGGSIAAGSTLSRFSPCSADLALLDRGEKGVPIARRLLGTGHRELGDGFVKFGPIADIRR
jgi:hypothetical protein